jgi:inner membrane protein
MLILGHAAGAAAAARWVNEEVDLRWVVTFAVLADLVDKPIGLVIFRETLNNGRVYFHSILVNLLVMLVLLILGKPLVYSLALWIHQLSDLMWTRPWVALWPFTGAFGYRDLPIEEWVHSAFGPYNITTEIAGLCFFTWLVFRYRLHEGRRLRYVLMSGRLPSPGSDTSPTSTPSNALGGFAS